MKNVPKISLLPMEKPNIIKNDITIEVNTYFNHISTFQSITSSTEYLLTEL